MRLLRRAASLLVRGPNADFIRHDLEDIYVRDRANGLSAWRAHLRYLRLLMHSALSVWHPEERLASSVEWLAEFRTGEALRDVRFGARLLRKHAISAGIAIAGLGMAIGIVVSVFTIIDATMLRPYAMDDPASVVGVGSVRLHGWPTWPYSSYVRMREEAALARIEASRVEKVRISTTTRDGGDVSRFMLFVSGGYLDMLGGRPLHGRPLTAQDDSASAPPVVMIGHHLWSSALNADPAAIGRTIWVNGVATTLVGVMRPDFSGPIDADIRPAIWAPLSAFDELLGGKPFDRDARMTVEVTARLKPGVSARAVEDNLSAIVNRLRPPSAEGHPSRSVRIDSLASPMAGRDAAENYLVIATIFGIVGLVLVLACANTANLLLAAATTRMSEMGTRLALGASRARIVNQMVNESLVLCVTAGGLGLVLSIWLVPVLRAALDLPPDVAVRPDGRAVLFTIGVAVVCGLGAGLSPARHGARGSVLAALRSPGTTNGAGALPSRLRTTFVGFQAAVSVFLLVAAALLARSAMHATRDGVGFDVDRLLAVAIERGNHEVYARVALDAVRRIPSVERAALVQYQPFGHVEEGDGFAYNGRWYRLNVTRCDAGFFQAAGLRILRGRAFSEEEVAHEAAVAMISDNVARELFPGVDPIGQSLSSLPPGKGGREPATIVGIVADAMLNPIRSESSGNIYRPMRRALDNPPVLLVRAQNPWLTARAVEESLRRADPSKRPTISIVREGLDAYLGTKRMFASLAVPTALLALLLATLGVFGVTAFVVNQRTPEMSVRMALGASAADVARLLLGDSLRPVLGGLIVGLGAALFFSRLSARELLGGLSPYDPLAIGIGTGSLIVASLVAVIVPVRRAAKTDPARLLRAG